MTTTTHNTTGTTYTLPLTVPLTINNNSTTLTGSVQLESITPDPIVKYLREMEWYQMGHRWGHKELPNAYLFWEQAVVYCLVRPFFTEK